MEDRLQPYEGQSHEEARRHGLCTPRGKIGPVGGGFSHASCK